jgi:hypothetical protein
MYVGLRYDPRKEHTIYLTGYDQRSLVEQRRREAIAFDFGTLAEFTAIRVGQEERE